MTTVLLNLPHQDTIQRRYMCSYNAPNMLFPPLELLAIGGITTKWKKGNTHLIDAIAENITLEQTITRLKGLNPDIIISICGFECFEDDMHVFAVIKDSFPQSKTVLFGHYATVFAKEILNHFNFDFVILGEPDVKFSNLYDALAGEIELKEVKGIAYKDSTGVIIQDGDDRISHPDELPMPAYELLQANKYYEPFLKGPFGMIQSARGCPYTCNYCVKSYGQKLTYRSPDQIIDEIVFLKEHFGIRTIRFIDDTFTVSSRRVIEICKKMLEKNLNIDWTCLSRSDILKEEMLPWMQKAGCKRIYFGLESGSPKVLKYLSKEMDIEQSLLNLKLCKQYGIETLGFFIVGAPVEEEEDFNMSVNFAIEANLDYVVVSELVPYPGTPYFDLVKEQVDFTILPYKNEWKDKSVIERNKQRERDFYRKFYVSQRKVKGTLSKLILHPIEFMRNFIKLASYIFDGRSQERRADYM